MLSYRWLITQSPAEGGATIQDLQAAKMSVEFTRPGWCIIEPVVDDGQANDHLGAAEVVVIVVGIPSTYQLPGDCSQDQALGIFDAVCLLGPLFLGDPAVLPCERGGLLSEGSRTLFDYNDDGGVDITDPINVLGRLFLGEGPHDLGENCIAIPGCPNLCNVR